MLAPIRQSKILDALARAGAVRVGELAQLLNVSEMTVRRDLDVLDRRGLLTKVHGGATSLDTRSREEPGFERKSARDLLEKQAIASVAAEIVRPGNAVALSAGTTTWTLAHHLRGIADLTVVTNSMRIATVLHEQEQPDLTVILTGGTRTPSDALVGPIAVSALASLHLDITFMGVHGMDHKAGLTTPNLLEAETNRAFIDAARQLIVVADHTKWGIVGLSEIAPLESVDVLVTDDGLPDEARQVLTDTVGDLCLAPVPTSTSSQVV